MYDSVTGAPVEGAIVVLEELRRQTRSDPTGVFTFDNVPAGAYHIGVGAEGYSSRRTEVEVTTVAARAWTCWWIRNSLSGSRFETLDG